MTKMKHIPALLLPMMLVAAAAQAQDIGNPDPGTLETLTLQLSARARTE